MIIIVGLGNPGPRYEGTRHNAGFLAVDRLADKLDVPFKKEYKFESLVARSYKNDVFLVKPQTFMNASGRAVHQLASFCGVKPNNIWVVYDDVDLPVGTARVRSKGTGEGSHRGVQSIVSALGTAEFPRFRIGIARSTAAGNAADRPFQSFDLKTFVLAPFDKREQPLVEKAIAWVIEEMRSALKKGRVISRTLTKGV